MTDEQLEQVWKNMHEARAAGQVVKDALEDCVNYLNTLTAKTEEVRRLVDADLLAKRPQKKVP